jgi:hypothetical protein
MADVLAGLLGGMQAGKAANAARAAAEEKRKQDAAEWELKLAGESRLLTGAAEDEWQKMEESTNADDWDTAKVPSLLDRAVRFDQTYGKVWRGKSAFKYFSEALHVQPQKVSGAVEPGKQGPPAPDTERQHPLMGFRSQAQKDNIAKAEREMRTLEKMPEIRKRALHYLDQTRVNGMYEPTRAYEALSRFEAELTAREDLDPLQVEKIIDDIEASLGTTFEEVFRRTGKGEDFTRELGVASNRLSTWLRQSMGLKEDAFDFERQFAAKAPMILKIEQFMTRKLMAGAPEPMVKWEAIQRYKNDLGQWELDPRQIPHFTALAGAPPAALRAAKAVFASGAIQDDTNIKPVFNVELNEGYFIDTLRGDSMKFWPPTNDKGIPPANPMPNTVKPKPGGAGGSW